ncbi:unnamed protein product, partial [Meganyctiphanes norvegica]
SYVQFSGDLECSTPDLSQICHHYPHISEQRKVKGDSAPTSTDTDVDPSEEISSIEVGLNYATDNCLKIFHKSFEKRRHNLKDDFLQVGYHTRASPDNGEKQTLRGRSNHTKETAPQLLSLLSVVTVRFGGSGDRDNFVPWNIIPYKTRNVPLKTLVPQGSIRKSHLKTLHGTSKIGETNCCCTSLLQTAFSQVNNSDSGHSRSSRSRRLSTINRGSNITHCIKSSHRRGSVEATYNCRGILLGGTSIHRRSLLKGNYKGIIIHNDPFGNKAQSQKRAYLPFYQKENKQGTLRTNIREKAFI